MALSRGHRIALKTLHWVIIINFLAQIFYSGYKTLSHPTGVPRVLFGESASIAFEDMVVRRLYAVETWVAITGLSCYLAITLILPHLRWTARE